MPAGSAPPRRNAKGGLDTVGSLWTADNPHVADLGRSAGEYHDDLLATAIGELLGCGTDSACEELAILKDASRAGIGQGGDQKADEKHLRASNKSGRRRP
ncbi:uncharacterized protein PgNI_08592 [Pyricularia grisea]|uniref:Uncharacterized protein n=1 Tax=Pyricularia grisea TaxID=148305 RepID=A0A6P8AV12_PYRGI|nr:uncharacterized protein PgNI_08592 [Pyricularia grisea]TLD06040.1 hypothetical protein PgNI_08592 [Pyricularia grisea]